MAFVVQAIHRLGQIGNLFVITWQLVPWFASDTVRACCAKFVEPRHGVCRSKARPQVFANWDEEIAGLGRDSRLPGRGSAFWMIFAERRFDSDTLTIRCRVEGGWLVLI